MASNTLQTKHLDKIMKCGIVMPISKHPEYPDSHWLDVRNILYEAIGETEFEPLLVSDDPAIGLIHERIVTNLYSNEIVVCDVSSVNPNVMFELGLRLAFDKPTIIIKDERTGFSFDTGIIEHIPYPSSLRFSQIIEFKQALIKKINGTYDKSKQDPHFSPFLKSFGQKIVPAVINGQEISETKFILQRLQGIQNEVRNLRKEQNSFTTWDERIENDINFSKTKDLYFHELNIKEILDMLKIEKTSKNIKDAISEYMKVNNVSFANEELSYLISSLSKG